MEVEDEANMLKKFFLTALNGGLFTVFAVIIWVFKYSTIIVVSMLLSIFKS